MHAIMSLKEIKISMRIGNEMEFMATRGSDGVAAARIWEKQVNGYVLKSIPHHDVLPFHFMSAMDM